MADVQGSFATSAVPGTRFTDVRWVAETGSTNADLLAAAAEGAPAGVVLLADHQSAGRGRLDRSWVAPAGSSLLVSVLLRPELPPDRLFLVTAAAGVASVDACAEVAQASLGLKWPNDLVVTDGPLTDRKLSGVLAESVLTDGRVEAVVVGMGLNVNWGTAPPDELARIATSLDLVVGHPVDRELLLIEWLRCFDRRLTELESDPATLIDALRGRSATLGRPVRVEFADRTVEGVATDIDHDGHLRVRPADGGVDLVVTVADIVHLRMV